MAKQSWGSGSRQDPKRRAAIARARSISLKELFELPPSERQALINLMVEVRDPGNPEDGYLVRVNPENKAGHTRIRFQSHPDREPRELTTSRTRLGVRDAVYVFGKWGNYTQLRETAPDRHGVVEEYFPRKVEAQAETETETETADE